MTQRRILSRGEAMDLQALAEEVEQIAEAIRARSQEGKEAAYVGEPLEELQGLFPRLNLKVWGHEDGPTDQQRSR